MRAKKQQALQTVYDLFYGSGAWPGLSDLQVELNHRNRRSVDAARIVQPIPAALLKPLHYTDGYPVPTERLVLTIEGIARCVGGGEDTGNFVTAVRWLARRAERSDSTDQDESLIRFTKRQLADAVSLSLEADPKAVNRLIAILQAERCAQNSRDMQTNCGSVFCSHSNIWRFRGIERLSDYLKVKGSSPRPDIGAAAHAPRGWRRFWLFLTSQKALAIALVLIGVATLVIMLLLAAGPRECDDAKQVQRLLSFKHDNQL